MIKQQTSMEKQKLRVISDRYRVQSRLGRGGIAEVYHVVDEVSEKEMALKILFEEASQKPHLVGLFEREFHTLAQLAHPRIIEVYDYGFHQNRAYYTMELLDGSDLKSLAPMEWQKACSLLRDVASSLAFLHSRKLIHRDISSRNVRCDRNGRAKLIDFGALSPIGTTAKLIGTPAFVPPEAVNRQPLDQRTDLYSFGALAYLLITGRYAYKAHFISHLKDAWRSRPPSITELNQEVPRALSDLVMSLLSLDRAARPVYASEVAEMLGAYAGLEPDDTGSVKQAYLATPKLVGREDITTELLKEVVRLLGGNRVQPVLFEGPSGVGRSRLLAELVLGGKVIGASVLTTSADASLHGPYGVALDLVEQLFETCYDPAEDAVRPHITLLREAFPALAMLIQTRERNRTVDTFGFDTQSQELGEEVGDDVKPIERHKMRRLPLMQSERNVDDIESRPKVQQALLDLFLKVSKRRRMLIVVDDFHLVDEPSAAFITALALESRTRPMIIAMSVEQDKTPSATAAYQTLVRVANRIEVMPLDQESVGLLLRSIFGESPNNQLLAERLYGVSKGNPRAVMQLAQHLVDRGVVTYRSGAWTIPSQMTSTDLPDSLMEALRTKVKQFSNDGLTLIQSLALSSARTFSFKECQFLAENGDAARLTHELNRLVAADILSTDGQFYSFSQEALKGVLTEELDEATAHGAHMKLVKLFQQRDPLDFRAVQHLMKAGEFHEALDLLIEHIEITFNTVNQNREAQFDYLQALPAQWSLTIRDAMELIERLNRPRRQRCLIHFFFVRIASSTGMVQRKDFRSVIEQLYHDGGLDIYHKIGDDFTAAAKSESALQNDDSSEHASSSEQLAQQRLQHSLKRTQQRYDDTSFLERGFAPKEALAFLPGAVLSAAALATASFDYSVLQMLPSLQPLFPLSPIIKVLQEHVEAAGNLVVGDYDNARQRYLALLQWVIGPDSTGLDEAYREYMRCSFNYAVGLIETIGIPSSLERADTIDRHPIYQINAWAIRLVYYSRQGDSLQTQKCQQTMELLKLQIGSTQMFDEAQWFPMLTAFTVYDDLTGVQQAISHIEKMAERFDGWVPIYHYACGEFHRIRGEYENALKELQKALDQISPSRHAVWPYAAGAHLKVLIELNRISEAHTLALGYLKDIEQHKLYIVSDQVLLPLAVIESRLEQGASAEKRVQRVIDMWQGLGASGLFLGSAYETGARVSMADDRPKKYRKYIQLCKEQYLRKDHPLLVARYKKLVEDARSAFLGVKSDANLVARQTDVISNDGNLAAYVNKYLAKYQGQYDLMLGALDLIIRHTGSEEGYLYIATSRSLEPTVQIALQPPPEKSVKILQSTYKRIIERLSEDDGSETATQTETQTETQTRSDIDNLDDLAFESAQINSRLLLTNDNSKRVPVGAVILKGQSVSDRPIDQSFLDAVSNYLHQRIQKEERSSQQQSEKSDSSADESRYRIEAILGEGGMATVYKVRDSETGKLLALKRTRKAAGKGCCVSEQPIGSEQRAKLENTLRREYQMLKSLAHPRIVEVYDFGVDEEGPFYTMELLEASSLRQKAPMDWRAACALLRDLASGLSFLHARRLLHRDVSPRNVGMAQDNHIKLMDFGTTAPMGMPKDRVGTPPFIPPEVVYRQKLDQRSDLYSFGALAYWLLTGRHAFPARKPDDLNTLWRSPPPSVSEVVHKLETLEKIPEALDRLVMSLLNIDPLARPPSAADVMERLSVIASLKTDEQLAVPQAYLTTPTLMGRQQELIQVRKQVLRCLRRRGGTILIQGESGMGLSRLLDASVMEGKLAGLTVLKAEARSVGQGDYAVVKTLARQLMEEIPEIATNAAMPNLSLLEHIVPKLGDSVIRGAGLMTEKKKPEADSAQLYASIHELRPQIQAALRDWILEIGSQRPVMLAIDDLHLIDEPSVAFLALLSQMISDKQIMIVITSVGQTETLPSAIAIDSIRRASAYITLKALSLHDTLQVLESVFGQTSHVRLLTDRLYEVSQGNPQVVMQLSQHLLDAQVVCYQGGAWLVPAQLDNADLPSSLKDAFKARMEKLSADALQLAQTMALSRDQSFSFEECLLLTEHKDPDRLSLSIDELLAFDIIMSNGEHYTSSNRGWIPVLQEQLDIHAEREAHRRIAEAFDSRKTNKFRVGYHLIRCGNEDRAIDVLLDFGRESKELNRQNPEAFTRLLATLPHDWIQTFQTAIDLAKKRGRSPLEIHSMQSRQNALGAIINLVNKQHAKELYDQLYRDSGLEFYHQLSDSLEKEERIQQALALAQQRYDATPEPERVLAPLEAIREMAVALIEAMSQALMFGDITSWDSLPSIRPYTALSPRLDIVDKLVDAVRDSIRGRLEQYYRGIKQVAERLEQPDHAGFEGAHYQYLRYSIIFSRGLMEASKGQKLALERATALETSSLLQINAWQIRHLYHLWQGAAAETQECKRQTETLQILNSPTRTWFGRVLRSELRAYCLADDLSSLKNLMREIEKMTSISSAWSPTLHYAKGEYNRIRGDCSSAINELNEGLQFTAPGRHQDWCPLADAYLRTLLELEENEQVRIEAQQFLQAAEREELGYMCNYLRMSLAIAQARLKDHDAAMNDADVVIESFKENAPARLNLGMAYEVRTRIAIIMDDEASFVRYSRLCAEQYRRGGNSCLVNKYEKIIQEARKAEFSVPILSNTPIIHNINIEKCKEYQETRAAFDQIQDSTQRLDRALAILVDNCDAEGGYLFGYRDEGLELVFSNIDSSATEELLKTVKGYLEAELRDSNRVTVTLADENALDGNHPIFVLEDGRQLEMVLLRSYRQNQSIVVGVAALIPAHGLLLVPIPNVVHAICDTLLENGEVISRIAA